MKEWRIACCLNAKTQYRKFEIYIPREGISRGISPNFHIHVSVSDLYIILRSVCLCYRRKICGPILGIQYKNRSQTQHCGNWDCGRAIPLQGMHKWNFRCSVVTWGVLLNAPVNAQLTLQVAQFPPRILYRSTVWSAELMHGAYLETTSTRPRNS